MFDFLLKYTPWLEQVYYGNTLRQYLIALGILLLFWVFFKYFKRRLMSGLEKWATRTKNDFDNEFYKIIQKIPELLYFFAALYFAIQVIEVHQLAIHMVEIGLVILLVYWGAKVASQLIEYGLYRLARHRGEVRSHKKNTTYVALSLIAKIVLWSTGFLLILSNLGVNISALIASLGIGGIAVALAVQNVLGDMFSSFSIYLDKPFEIGDYIIVGKHEGTVKSIGLKSTRIEALQGEEIVISNNELTSTRIRNFKRMKKRRIAFQIGVTYDTKPAKLTNIPAIIEKLMHPIDMIEYDRTHFREFADSSLIFEIVYFINSGVYRDYIDRQHEINIAIMTAFGKEKIEMAFPTQTVHLKSSS